MPRDPRTPIVIMFFAGIAGFMVGAGLNITGVAPCAAPVSLAIAGIAAGFLFSRFFGDAIQRYFDRKAEESDRKFRESPEGKEWRAKLDTLNAIPTDEARRRALELLHRTPTRPTRGPTPPAIALLPCGVGELLSTYEEIVFGEFHDWIAQRAVETRKLGGRMVTSFGGDESSVFAIDYGPPARIILYGPNPAWRGVPLEHPSVYHLLLHSGEAGIPDICPKCNYNLEGLDAPRRCPECGGPIMDLDYP